MVVYDATPSGLAPAHLAAAARRDPAAARSAAARIVVGLVAIAAATVAPLGWLWAIGGVASLASTLTFARSSARLAVETPSLVAEGRPSWEGVKRSLFVVRADDVDVVGRALAAALDATCGEAVAGFDGVDAVDRSEGLSHPEREVVVAWGVGRPPALRARGNTNGIWMRRRPSTGSDPARIEVLADPGEPESTLRRVAAGL